ncbi:MAG: pitrilysin family protein [Nitrospinota bacterium]
MKLRVLIAFLGVLSLSAPAYAKKAPHPSELEFPPLKFEIPKTERVVLGNGMVLHLMEDHELPIIQVSAKVRIGGAWEPSDKIGLASLTGSVWRSGGVQSMPPEELDEKLEFLGASVETGISGKGGSVSLSVLKKDIDTGLEIFADVIKNPAFDKSRFDVAKNRMIEGIRRQNDEPNGIVGREFSKTILPNHPFGRSPTMESVKSIVREDTIRFYKDHVGPESFIVGISGDFDSKDMIERFEKLFADFKPAKKKFAQIPNTPDNVENPGFYVVDKKIPQSALRLGNIGVSRKNPDYFAVRVMNFVLGGGGFSSRLMQEIRSNRGLAYSVWSYFMGGENQRGLFMIGGETKAETTAEFIEVARGIMREVIEKGVTEKELVLAKQSIVNRFIFGFDNTAKVVSQYVWVEYHGLPKSWLEYFRTGIQKVTMKDVKRAAEKYLHPDAMVMLIVGDKPVFEKEIAKAGPITVLKLDN